jgi:hypothetical protein
MKEDHDTSPDRLLASRIPRSPVKPVPLHSRRGRLRQGAKKILRWVRHCELPPEETQQIETLARIIVEIIDADHR